VRVCGARLARATASARTCRACAGEEMAMLTPEAHHAMLQILDNRDATPDRFERKCGVPNVQASKPERQRSGANRNRNEVHDWRRAFIRDSARGGGASLGAFQGCSVAGARPATYQNTCSKPARHSGSACAGRLSPQVSSCRLEHVLPTQ
jgi:hypothetical protein